jgi:hypothetical protein
MLINQGFQSQQEFQANIRRKLKENWYEEVWGNLTRQYFSSCNDRERGSRWMEPV